MGKRVDECGGSALYCELEGGYLLLSERKIRMQYHLIGVLT